MTTQNKIPKTWRSELASLDPLTRIVTVGDLMRYSHTQQLQDFFISMKKDNFKKLKWCLENHFKLSPMSIQNLCDKASTKFCPGRYILSELPLETFKLKFLVADISINLDAEILTILRRMKHSEQKLEEESSEEPSEE